MEKIWDILNEPFSVALLIPCLGWLFIKIVWEPHIKRSSNERDKKMYKEEISCRLIEIESFITHEWFGTGINNLINGDASFNPNLKLWSLKRLVLVAWGKKYYLDLELVIDELKQQSFNFEKKMSKDDIIQNMQKALITLNKKLLQ